MDSEWKVMVTAVSQTPAFNSQACTLSPNEAINGENFPALRSQGSMLFIQLTQMSLPSGKTKFKKNGSIFGEQFKSRDNCIRKSSSITSYLPFYYQIGNRKLPNKIGILLGNFLLWALSNIKDGDHQIYSSFPVNNIINQIPQFQSK